MNDNKLIAEFMGIVYPKLDNVIVIDNVVIKEDELQYHISWDWLMPVVQKIKRTDLSREMVMQGMDELIDGFDTDIKNTYKSVVEFIKEYNDGE